MRTHKPPSEDMKAFLVETVTKLNGVERLENQDLAKFLIDKHRGPTKFNTNEIGDSFSWLEKIGVISYDRVYEPSGGWRMHLYRLCSDADVEGLIMGSGDVRIKDAPPPERPEKKSCCDKPHVVKSKKTGKRKCRNCDQPYPDKKPGA